MDNPLAELWQSSNDLNKRFGIDPLEQDSVKIFMEECKELITAYFNYNAMFDGDTLDALNTNMVDEFADVLVTAIQMTLARGLTMYDLRKGIERTVRKNNAKTHETHELDAETRKIRRKAPKS